MEPLLVRYDDEKKKEKGREEGGKFLCTNEGIFIIHPTVNRLPIFPRELINFLFPDDDLSSVPLSRIFRDRRCVDTNSIVRYPTKNFHCVDVSFIFFFSSKRYEATKTDRNFAHTCTRSTGVKRANLNIYDIKAPHQTVQTFANIGEWGSVLC